MADEKDGKDGRLGPFLLGRRCEEVGPELGRLYESRNLETGQPALTLVPGDRVEWNPGGSWVLRLSCQSKPASVSMEVERAPASAPVTRMADILVLMTAAVERVEDSASVQAHFIRGAPRPMTPWLPRAIAGLAVLSLGLGLWLHFTRTPEPREPLPPSMTSRGVLTPRPEAPSVIDTESAPPPGLAYPLPQEPFSNQAKAPCKTQKLEIEINGGCWVELAQLPPCAEDRAEHQGKCYLPVSKDRGHAPSSVGQ
jgi:hypothetical protein